MKSTLLMPVVFVAFSALFFVIGALLQADKNEALYIFCFMVAGASAFCFRVSPLFNETVKYHSLKGSTFILSAVLSLILSLVIFSVIFDIYKYPIFSNNMEYDRMIAVIDWGVIYRIANQSLYVTAALLGFGFAKGRRVTKVVSIFVLVMGFALVFALGFRSRLLDFLLVFVVGTLVAKMIEPTSKWRAKALIPIVLGGTIFFISAFLAIIHVTAVREGGTYVEALGSVIDRAFLLNYRVNFWRVYSYVEQQGLLWGQTYVQDPVSLILPESISSQQLITRHFNQINSQVFTMTPTVFGEAFINFGWASAIMIPVIIIAHRILFEYLIFYIKRFLYAPVFYAILAVYIYTVPRLTVTGGVSQAFFLNLLVFIIIALLLSIPFILLSSIKKGSAKNAINSPNY